MVIGVTVNGERDIADLTVLHLDKDFELIAEVTGQSLERLRERPGE